MVFNQVAALQALRATPMKSGRSGGCGHEGEFMKTLKSCISSAKEEGVVQISMAQIRAMMQASTEGGELTDALKKRVSDSVWGLSDKNKKNDAPLLKGVSNGVYEIL